MDLLNLMREIAAFLLLIQWKPSDSASHSFVATCQQQSHDDEEYIYHEWNPSPVHDLTAELSESQSSLTIRWAINVDSTIRNLTGTWITWSEANDNTESSYRCGYKPEFSSDQISLAGLQQLWFSFTVPNVSVCPSNKYHFLAYNLPTSNTGTGSTYTKTFKAAEIQWNAHIYSVLHDDKIMVTFNESSAADRHTINLENPKEILKTVEIKEGCKVEKCQVELEYTGPCEDLTILITPHFEHCKGIDEVQHEVICTNKSGLAIGVGCVLALLFVLLCCCITCQVLRWGRGSKRGVSVRVLLVYPAVDGVFQRAVMLLAQSLHRRAGVTVVIDVWDRASLAEQGPLRWINTQAELADRVLLITPPQTDDLKSNLVPGVSDDTVSASASSLFALTLNLLSSAAHDPLGRDKFWVVNLRAEDQSEQPELRGFRRFLLPRDSEKLHQKVSRREMCSCFSSFTFRNALEKMEIHTDLLTCAEDLSRDQTPHLLP
ncbi:interleukin-17 receptor B [Rhinichthys klamathensis goyatoka]|uniref:interleukin-17 receptor B n=1 Tax=Rhinichthys klamathensis goyatoka TaxID=3034132 RepID=UPI0024B4F5B8|nr:interleukin-17 receptor B [Rhinichthys klamathensis goyatoka]